MVAVLATAAPAFAQDAGERGAGERLTPQPQFFLYLGPRVDPMLADKSPDRITRDGFAPFVLYLGPIRVPSPITTTADNIK